MGRSGHERALEGPSTLPIATSGLTPRVRALSLRVVKRFTAVCLILAVAVATSHLGWPCACDDVTGSETAMADDHSCCPGAKAEAEAEVAPAEAVVEGACAPGCCDAPAIVTSLAAERSFTWDASPPVLAPVGFGTSLAALTTPARVLVAAHAPRGPPEPLPLRLALLQTWRC